ncbi:MAG: hypothetical protein IH946_09175 [Bacteroidetes bacterium]|nr:hypothetical protein [Bacteroidota bacterium]
MKFNQKDPPRKFTVNKNVVVDIYDHGTIDLEANEQVTFITKNGAEYDVARKSWGFYATPSVNGRLKDFGFKTALVRNDQNRYYVMLVEDGKLDDFVRYITDDKQEVVEWLDER